MIKKVMLLLIVSACGKDLPVKDSPEDISGPIEKRPMVDKGWLPAYSEHIKKTVEKLPGLLEISQKEMASLCLGWNKLKKPERIDMYVDLIYSIALAESNYNRFAWYTENLGTDRVTGHQVRSEGLLQLSYQDPKNYMGYDKRAYEFCPFNYDRDKIAYEVALSTKNPRAMGDRTIQNPYANLSCGVFIIHLVTAKLRPISSDKWDVATSIQAYWSVTRPKNAAAYKKVMTQFHKLQPLCK